MWLPCSNTVTLPLLGFLVTVVLDDAQLVEPPDNSDLIA